MKKLITLITILISLALVSCSTPSDSPSTSTLNAEVATTSTLPTEDHCVGDELCYTLEAETRAWELFDTFKVADTFTLPSEVIYMGYYDGMPVLADYEGVVVDPDTNRHYVFAVFADMDYIHT